MSIYLVVKPIGLKILYLRMQVLTIWILFQRLGVANKTILLELSQKVELFLLSSTLNSDWRIYLVERRYIYIPVRAVKNRLNIILFFIFIILNLGKKSMI